MQVNYCDFCNATLKSKYYILGYKLLDENEERHILELLYSNPAEAMKREKNSNKGQVTLQICSECLELIKKLSKIKKWRRANLNKKVDKLFNEYKKASKKEQDQKIKEIIKDLKDKKE